MKKRIAQAFCIVLFLCVMFLYDISADNADSVKKVRVGFPIQAGLTEKDENGQYTGYTVDYLNQLVKYVNWEVEYVEAEGDINEQLTTLLDMLAKGEIDIMGAMNYNEKLEEMYLYPSYNYGTAYTMLAVREDDSRWIEDDYQNWDGISVAVYPDMKRRLGLLKKFAEVSGFTYETVEVDSYVEMMEAIRSKEADAVLQVDIASEEGMRGIARFSPSPYYFAVSKDRTDILRDLNAGMNSLLQAYPNLQTELYNKYFMAESNFLISDEDKEWISGLEPQRIMFFDGNAPIQSAGNDSGGSGVAKSFVNKFAEVTGLAWTPVIARDYQDGLNKIRNGEVDIVAAVPGDAALPSAANLRLSLPYFESKTVVVSGPTSNATDEIDFKTMSANVEKELGALKESVNKKVLLDAYCVNFYMQKQELYKTLSADWGNSSQILYSVGFASGTDERLITVFNNFVRSLDDDSRQQMLYLNSREHATYTIWEFLQVYRWQLTMMAIVAVLLLYLYHLYKKNRDYRRSYTASERLYQYSQMINECLFEYDFKEDQLILQNNKLFFEDRHVVGDFLERTEDFQFKDENEEKCVSILQDMLRKQKCKGEMVLNTGGMEAWYKVSIAYVDGVYAVGRISDESNDIQERHELERKVSTDILTGLLNRAALDRAISRHINAGDKGGVYLLLDLDNFKRVNDTIGHQKGDYLLKQFAGALVKGFRDSDLKARLGGDEFVVFMPNQVDEEILRKKLSSFIQYVDREIFGEYSVCEVSVSIGAAFIRGESSTVSSLYREADSAMYVAKCGGKNDFFISDGTVCTRRECINCRQDCRKKDYLMAKGVY